MQRKNLLSFAALSASFLLPVSGAYADQNDTGANKDSTTSMSKGMNEAGLGNTVMDAGQYRDTLHNIRDLLSEIRENGRLAMAAQDPLTRAQYQSDNQVMATQVLGLLNSVTRDWRHSDIPSMGTETAEMRSSRSEERMGSADMQRYATESPDTAIVRNAVWEIQGDLQGDKLNGRGPVVTKHTLKLLDTAINHAENPGFKVEKAASQDQQESTKETTKTEDSTSSSQQATPAPEPPATTPAPEATPAPEQPAAPPAPDQAAPAPEQPVTPPAPDQAAPAPEQPVTPPAPEQTTPAPEQPVTPPAPEQTTPAPEQPSVAPTPEQTTPAPEPPVASPETPADNTNTAPTTTDDTGIDTTPTDRSGAANLPQTGGDPGLVVLLGSSLMGLGAFLRRRG